MEKAKLIHGDKPFGKRTVLALEKDVSTRFETFRRTVDEVVTGQLACCIVFGTAGVGKSHTVKQVLEQRGLEPGKDYAWVTSKCTPPSLYETAAIFRKGGIVVLDDVSFNAGKDKKVMEELLKALTDTYDERIVSWTTKATTIEIVSDPGEEAEKVFKAREEGHSKKLPSQYKFEGRVIVITNLTESDFDPALISRSIAVPLFLTEEEKLEHMRIKLREIRPDMDLGLKEQVLTRLIDYHAENTELNDAAGLGKLFETQLDLRTLVQALKMAEGDPSWEQRLHLL